MPLTTRVRAQLGSQLAICPHTHTHTRTHARTLLPICLPSRLVYSACVCVCVGVIQWSLACLWLYTLRCSSLSPRTRTHSCIRIDRQIDRLRETERYRQTDRQSEAVQYFVAVIPNVLRKDYLAKLLTVWCNNTDYLQCTHLVQVYSVCVCVCVCMCQSEVYEYIADNMLLTCVSVTYDIKYVCICVCFYLYFLFMCVRTHICMYIEHFYKPYYLIKVLADCSHALCLGSGRVAVCSLFIQHTHTHTHILHTHTHTHPHTRTRRYRRARPLAHTHTHTRVRTDTHAHSQKHTRKHTDCGGWIPLVRWYRLLLLSVYRITERSADTWHT